jgi:hypothetical protein
MRRGQATIEYALLIAALMVGLCLLVRFPTPVQWMARSIAYAVSPRPSGGHRHGGAHPGGHRRPPHRHPNPCICQPVTLVPGG